MAAMSVSLRTGLALLVLASSCSEGRAPAAVSEPRTTGGALHLFDVAPDRIERELPQGLERLLAPEDVVVEEQFGAGAFERVDSSREGLWRADASFPIAEARLVRVEDAADPDAGEPTPLEHPDSAGWVVLGPEGVTVATDGDRPAPLQVRYRTSSRAVRQRATGLPEVSGELQLIPFLQLGLEARRTAAATPSRIVWTLDVPARGRLLLGYAVRRFGLRPSEAGLRVFRGVTGEAALRVEVHPATGGAVVLHEETVGREAAARFHDLELDLAPYEGTTVELHLVTELGATDAPPCFPVWSEPVLVAPDHEPRTSVVLFQVDTLRADRLGCYGWERAHTPHLDDLARRGVRFEHAVSGAPWTLPSHATLFTSLYVSQHGVHDERQRLPEEVVTLAEVLRAEGYRTRGLADGALLRPQFGFAQGFDAYFNRDGGPEWRNLRGKLDGALEWMSDAGAPYFVFVQTYLVHDPYDPPEPWRSQLVRPYDGPLPASVLLVDFAWGSGTARDALAERDRRYVSDLYDAEIAFLDDELGRFLEGMEARGLLGDTLIVVTSDHGEEFGDHGRYGHGRSLYEEQLHVPLILWHHERFAGGRTVSHPVHAVDLAPTIVDLVGGRIPPGWTGRPLRMEAPDEDEVMFSPFFDRARGAPAVALRVGPMKYIDFPAAPGSAGPAPEGELYDLERDPGELRNLITDEERERWRKAAEELWARFGPRTEVERLDASPELEAELRALGYVEGGG